MMTKAFWVASGERAGKAFIQTLISALVVGGTLTLVGVDWKPVLATAVAATVLSVVSSLISLRIGPAGSPSAVVDPHAAP